MEVWLPRGLTRFTVLELIELATRRVHVAGLTTEPDGPIHCRQRFGGMLKYYRQAA